jgi:nitroreductase
MDVFEAMRTCRAIRRLRPDPIPPALLRRVLEAATWAPSGGNRQPWRFIVVHDPQLKTALRDLYLPTWRAYREERGRRAAELPEVRRRRAERGLAAGDHLAAHLHEAPVIVVVCARLKDLMITDAQLGRPSVVGGASIYPAVQNLLLACRAVGLGAVLTTLLCLHEPEVRGLLGIPDGWATCAHVPIGWPAGTGYGPVDRKPLAALAFADRWGTPFAP